MANILYNTCLYTHRILYKCCIAHAYMPYPYDWPTYITDLSNIYTSNLISIQLLLLLLVVQGPARGHPDRVHQRHIPGHEKLGVNGVKSRGCKVGVKLGVKRLRVRVYYCHIYNYSWICYMLDAIILDILSYCIQTSIYTCACLLQWVYKVPLS